MSGVDPITLEVIRNRLDVIADEMESTLLKSAFSPIIREAADASAALFDIEAQTLAQAAALPAHLGMLLPAVQEIVNCFPPEQMDPGDLYILNDPFQGGTHLPDIAVVMPVFVDGRPIALSASLAHHQDVGGQAPGSTPPNATEIFAEGLIIPPLKLYDRGEPNQTLLDLIGRNVRIPYIVLGDVDAQIACVRIGARRMQELAEQYTAPVLEQAFVDLLDHAERMTRASIREIPDGVYRFHDYIDDDGLGGGDPIRIEATVTVDGDQIDFDFTGSGPQARGAINSVPSSTMAIVYYTIRTMTDPAIPNNSGCYRPITATLPPGTVVNPSKPAAVSVRTVVIKRVVDVLLGCFAQAAPERVHAASNGQLASMKLGGFDPKRQQPFVANAGVPTAGGLGARPTKDGIDVIDTDLSNMMSPPVEAIEQDYPVRVHGIRLWTDSGGAGRFRGGLGYVSDWEILRGEATFTHRRDRHKLPPWGLFGGKPAPTCYTELHGVDGTVTEIPSKRVLGLRAGDVVRVYTTGGGGYGSPLERDPEAVRLDVLDRRVSREAARDIYGVVLDGRDMVDHEATAAARSRLRAATTNGNASAVFDRGKEYIALFGRSQHTIMEGDDES
jgi:N-methylhydantoinase B